MDGVDAARCVREGAVSHRRKRTANQEVSDRRTRTDAYLKAKEWLLEAEVLQDLLSEALFEKNLVAADRLSVRIHYLYIAAERAARIARGYHPFRST